MGDFTPTGRKKPRRILKRLLYLLGILAALLVVFLVVAYFFLRSNFFWREVVADRFFGPYWETALTWEDFTPHVYPPGITFRNLELREPGDNGTLVLHIEEFRALGSWATRPDLIDLEEVRLNGLFVNLIKFEDGETNLDRAITRLFEGMPPRRPSPTGRDLPRDRDLIPVINIMKSHLEGFSLRYEDRTTANGNPLIAHLIVAEPLDLRLQPNATGFSPGRLDEFFAVNGHGLLNVHNGDHTMESSVKFGVESLNFGDFPNNSVSFDLAFTPREKSSPRFAFGATTPLERAGIRAIAIPFEDLYLELEGEGGKNLVSLNNASFDPLRGALRGDFQMDFSLPEIWSFVDAYLANGMTPEEIHEFIGRPNLDMLGGIHAPVYMALDSRLAVDGIAQYAAVDPEERMPLRITADGTTSLNDLSPDHFPAWSELWGAAWEADPKLPRTLEAQTIWEIDASELDNTAGILMELNINPTGWDVDRLGVRIVVSEKDDQSVKMRFNPFDDDAISVLKSLMDPVEPLETSYQFLADYENLVRSFGVPLARMMTALEEMNLEPARISKSFNVRDPDAMRALIEPIFGGAESGTIGSLFLDIIHEGGNAPLSVTSGFEFEGIRMTDLEGTVVVSGEADLIQFNSNLIVTDLDLRMERKGQPGDIVPPVLQLELSRSGLDGTAGPPPPTQINLETGVAHFDITANTMSREIVEILLRVQSFNISEQLSTPFYANLLDLLGFTPGDPEARGEAKFALSGDLGPVFRMASQVNLDHLPIRGLLFSQAAAAEADTDRFHARLSQQIALDRENLLLKPERFELLLFLPEVEREFASLRLLPDEDTALDYVRLGEFADQEVTLLTDRTVDADVPQLRQFAHNFLERARRFQRTIQHGGADLVFALPETDLMAFSPLFHDAGIPLSSGRIDFELTTRAERGEDLPATSAKGRFLLDKVRLEGMEEDLPALTASLDLWQVGTVITLSDLSTEIQMDPNFPPTRLDFRGEADVDTLASDWSFNLSQINASVLSLLQRLEDGGISVAARLLDAMPTQRLTEIAGTDGSIGLSLDGTTSADGEEIFLRALQHGRGLSVLPRFFKPMSFDLLTEIRRLPEGVVRIERLDGAVHEEGLEAPLITSKLDHPVVLGPLSPVMGQDARLTVEARKDLGDFAGRLREMPLPFYERAIVGGLVEGRVELVFPGGLLSTDFERAEIANDLYLSISDLELEGWPHKFESILTGRIEKSEESINLPSLEISTRIGEEPTGTLRATASYLIKEESLTGVVDLINLNSGMLDPLPEKFARWTQQPDARVDLQARLDSKINEGLGNLQLAIRAREIGLPPVQLADGTSFIHPPLHLDTDLLGSYDMSSSQISLDGFEFYLTGVTPQTAPRMTSLDRASTPLLTMSTEGKFVVDMETWGIGEQPRDGNRLRATMGPFDVEDYGILMQQLAGLPLIQGNIYGDLMIASRQVQQAIRNELVFTLHLNDGIWEGQLGPEQVEANIDLSGWAEGRQFEVENLGFRVMYPGHPDQTEDNLRASGTYDTQANRLRMQVASDQIAVDRVIRYAGDVQTVFSQIYPDGIPREEPEESATFVLESAPTSSFLKTLDGELLLSIDNMTFREINFPQTRAKAVFSESNLRLEELVSRTANSMIMFKGGVDLSEGETPWYLDLDIRNLQTTPWINSFGPQLLHDRVKGRLTATAKVTGKGFLTDDLRETLETDLNIRVREVAVDVPQLEAVLGGEGDVDANLRLLIRRNRASFDLLTPWNKWRHLAVRGKMRNVFAGEGENTTYETVARLVRTTPVGPPGRTMEWRGGQVPFRQEVLGVTVEARGVIQEDKTEVKLRNISY
ncbi:MAG: hypothetical protein JJU11_10765 [Candidatus Sumerlaeia bacterium]|nr:hypothetical protein [Candidatus Sumerlaeia bacterium]